RLASVLEATPEYLLFGRSGQRSIIWLEGRLGPGGALVADAKGEGGPLQVRDEQLTAFLLDDPAMAPAYPAGRILLAHASALEPPEVLFGEAAIVDLADGRVL